MQALRAKTFSKAPTIAIMVVSWSTIYHFICSPYLV
jgi:hypothetical protein